MAARSFRGSSVNSSYSNDFAIVQSLQIVQSASKSPTPAPIPSLTTIDRQKFDRWRSFDYYLLWQISAAKKVKKKARFAIKKNVKMLADRPLSASIL